MIPPPRRRLGAVPLYRQTVRTRDKLFSLLAGRSFAAFGPHSVLQMPIRLDGEWRISIGAHSFIGGDSWLQALDGESQDIAIRIGDRVSLAGSCVISAVRRVEIGDNVSFGRQVYVADHAHAYDDPTRPVRDQGITGVAPVTIEDGAWLGQGVIVMPGVRIGRGAVIAAGAVVARDIPEHCLAMGQPARVLRRFGPGEADQPSEVLVERP